MVHRKVEQNLAEGGGKGAAWSAGEPPVRESGRTRQDAARCGVCVCSGPEDGVCYRLLLRFNPASSVRGRITSSRFGLSRRAWRVEQTTGRAEIG